MKTKIRAQMLMVNKEAQQKFGRRQHYSKKIKKRLTYVRNRI